MQRVDKVSKAVQRDAVVLAVQILESCVDFENIGKGARALNTKFLS